MTLPARIDPPTFSPQLVQLHHLDPPLQMQQRVRLRRPIRTRRSRWRLCARSACHAHRLPAPHTCTHKLACRSSSLSVVNAPQPHAHTCLPVACTSHAHHSSKIWRRQCMPGSQPRLHPSSPWATLPAARTHPHPHANHSGQSRTAATHTADPNKQSH